ncbi:glyoxalase/bleomycin resistance protein/dioxygenase superfamily protein [Paraburkholderia sp. BL23I1N1]|uniref:VOC family protein n=1 Tax=Paraburkholderia sp. BL23I1N1 TaxID=1938802 RepID=UPI000E732DD1|nr:VOC family protein [Paraburkholderia sp. BL23I1N1]RKE38593.1 glyoxalase/bleomycin resistance protein/dioxygenase superfamily protein [Paraburkholderia sp. BL23I1N1]
MTDPRSLRRTGAVGVHSVNRFVFSVPDLDEAEHFYRTFGLDVHRRGERLDLHAFGHPHVWGSVHASGAVKKLEYVSYGIDADNLGIFRERIEHRGIACPPHPLSDGTGLWMRNPDGTPVQIVVAPKVSPSVKCRHTPRVEVPSGRGAAPARSLVSQVRPRAMSHVLFFTPDVKRMVTFSTHVLGMRLSDHSGDVIAFLHGVHGSDHHLVAFAKSRAPGLHHSSWDVGSIDDVGSGAEQMRVAGYDRGWGLGRHVLGSNYFHYVRDPWGSYAEYSFDIDFIPHDVDWPATDHPPHDSLYVWGPALPDDFITNYETTNGDAT